MDDGLRQRHVSLRFQLAVCFSVVLLSTSQERAVTEWHISIAWVDESCDSVCNSLGRQFRCTEDCWPAGGAALRSAVDDSPRLGSGTCFDVEAGAPAPWQPAKDPQNTMCYWDAGSFADKRCPTVANTSADLAEQGYFIRRLCPCYNRTAVELSGWMALDCAVGSFSVAPPPGSAAYSTSTAPSQNGALAAASLLSPEAAAAQGSYVASEAPGGDCQEICVTGFAQEDAHLNGHYVRMASQYGLLSHWSGGGYWLKRDASGHWRFIEVPADMEVARGTLRTQGLAGVPESDFFITATGGNQAYFQCCDRATQVSSAPLAHTADSAGVNEDTDSGKFIVVVLCIVFVICLLGGALWVLLSKYPQASALCPCRLALVKWWQRRRLKTYITMEPDSPERQAKNVDEGSIAGPECNGIGGAPTRSDYADYNGPSVAALERQFQEQQRKKKQGQRLDKAPDPQLSRGNGGGDEQRSGRAGKWRGRTQLVCTDRVDQPGRQQGGGGATASTDTSFAHRNELDAAFGVASVLGRASGTKSSNGMYEGPVNQWWEQKAAARPVELQSGTEVRLQGLVSQPTWNGTEGVVESFDQVKGHVQIRLPDGRVKAVRPENCEIMNGGGGAHHLAGHFGGGDFREPLQRPSTGSKLPPIVRSETKMTTVSGTSKLSKAPPPVPAPPSFGEGFQKGRADPSMRLEAPTPARAAAGGRGFAGGAPGGTAGGKGAAHAPMARPQNRSGNAGRQDSGGLSDDLDNAQFAVQAQLDTLKARLSDRPAGRHLR